MIAADCKNLKGTLPKGTREDTKIQAKKSSRILVAFRCEIPGNSRKVLSKTQAESEAALRTLSEGALWVLPNVRY